MTMIDMNGTSAFGLMIQSPGMVNASPPATMAPALMSVCVTLISCRVLFFARPRTDIESTVTKTVGHGRAPILSATYIELTVMISRPSIPVRAPRSVSCLLFSSFMMIISNKEDDTQKKESCTHGWTNTLHAVAIVISFGSVLILKDARRRAGGF